MIIDMGNSQLSSIANQGTRIIISANKNVHWVLDTPTEQQIIIFDTNAHKAKHYMRMRPDKDSRWYDWRVIGEKELQ